MRISEYYASVNCRKSADFRSLLASPNRIVILNDAISVVSEMLTKGDNDDAIKEYLRGRICYGEGDFDFPWMAEIIQKNDLYAFERFLKWFHEKGFVPVECNVPIDTDGFQTVIHLIVKKDGGTCTEGMGIRFFHKKISYSSSSYLSKVDDRLEILIPKLALEEKYPGIHISLFTMLNGDDKEDDVLTPEVSNATTQAGQYHFSSFSGYEFSIEKIRTRVEELKVMEKDSSCFGCRHRTLCFAKSIKGDVVSDVPNAPSAASSIPVFTKEQEEIVSHKNGPMLILAGPGRGKTAVLVGRCHRLVKNGVAKEDILLVTFTNKAADELMHRLGKGYIVSTLHSYAAQILREQLPGCKVISESDENIIWKSFLQKTARVKGLSYKVTWGRYGTVSAVKKRAAEYAADETAFRAKAEKDGLDVELFLQLVHGFEAYKKSRNFINYDEIIPTATTLLQKNEKMRRIYSVPYLMVDEYQDVDAQQALFIDTLAIEHNNLCVVGDDDQAIYGFRGGDNVYMLTFPDRFPGCKQVTLTRNFRSTPGICSFTDQFIRKNKKRFDKVSVSERPYLGKQVMGEESVKDAVSQLLVEGFKPKDIAVIARSNEELETIYRENDFDCILGREKLVFTPFFILFNAVLSYCLSGKELTDEQRFLIGTILPGKDNYADMLSDVILYSSEEELVSDFGDAVRKITGDTSLFVGETELKELAKESPSLAKLSSYLTALSAMEADERVCGGTYDEVTLITAHDAKGKEYKAVIVTGLCSFDPKKNANEEEIEEARRLLYVAMTRAEDALVLLDNGKKKSVSIA